MRFFVHIYRGSTLEKAKKESKNKYRQNETAENFQINYQP